jgi:alginate O-acetyltransferase complex protein AlgI
MLFTDSVFIVFFAVCFTLRWAIPGYTRQKYFLLLCNIVFYGAWDWRFLFLMGGYILFNHFIAHAVHRTAEEAERKRWIAVCVVGNLSVLGFFKYYNFFVSSGASLLTWLGVRVAPATLNIILPVGISFITFQAMSYVIDVYRRELEPVGLLDFAVFKSFFPQLVAGPIVRASAFLPQLRVQPRFADIDFRRWLCLFVVGYFKKACVADNLARAIDPVFANPTGHGASDALIAAAGYSIQIYCDFSGYTDMAIATAGMLGYSLARNFDAPYLSPNIRDFWRRWHISLSTWLRDYLYIPLGGGRGGEARTYFNLIVTMVLGGLWHGANMTFVLWGLFHGLALAAHRAWSGMLYARKISLPARLAPFSWALTLSWVVGLFTLFRCDSVASFGTLVSRFGDWQARTQLDTRLGWLIVGLGVVHGACYAARERLQHTMRITPAYAFAVLLGISVSFVLFFTPVSSEPFIYFQF